MNKTHFVNVDGKVYNADSCIPLINAWNKGNIELFTLARGTYPGKKLKKEDLSGIKSIGYWDARKIQEWGLPWHRNEGIEICFLETGKLHFSIQKEQYNLVPYDLTITRPWLLHKLGDPNIGACRLHWIILDVGVRHPHQHWEWPSWIILNKMDLDELTIYLRHNENPVWKSNHEILECFDRIGQVVKENLSSYDSKLKVLFNTLLVALLDLFRHDNIELNDSLIQSKRTVELFLNDLDKHLIEDWTIDSIANHCNLGLTQFTKYCKEITNMTPMSFLSSLRLKEAANLLSQNQNLSITEIAYQIGFSTPQYFSTVFRKT